MSQPSLLYAYAIVAPSDGSEPLAQLLQRVMGIDDLAVTTVSDAGASDAQKLSVLVSAVSAEAYVPEEVEGRVGELSWLAPRAEAHDRVVTAASDRTQIIPLPLFSLFRDESAVREMLASRRDELARLFARLRGAREYTVRLYRDDARLSAALAELSPRVRELERSAADAAPGQRYLLQRKLDEERRAELRRVSAEVAQQTFARLAPLARAAVRESLPAAIAGAEPGTGNTQPAILNASFLVEDEKLDDFRRQLSEVIALREPAGFRTEFTGPWPAYHFARETNG
jgi:gas vesicle protein GvpL/GvpF